MRSKPAIAYLHKNIYIYKQFLHHPPESGFFAQAQTCTASEPKEQTNTSALL